MANLSNIKIKYFNKNITSIIISEPKTYNALSFKNLKDLIKAFKKLDNDKNVKVIIIEGSGKGFSAGHNLKEVRDLKIRIKYQKLFNLCSKLMLQIVEGKKPVIAKVHGAAFAAARRRCLPRGGHCCSVVLGLSCHPNYCNNHDRRRPITANTFHTGLLKFHVRSRPPA